MSPKDDIDDTSAPLIEHLAELRNRLIWSVAAFIVGMVQGRACPDAANVPALLTASPAIETPAARSIPHTCAYPTSSR